MAYSKAFKYTLGFTINWTAPSAVKNTTWSVARIWGVKQLQVYAPSMVYTQYGVAANEMTALTENYGKIALKLICDYARKFGCS